MNALIPTDSTENYLLKKAAQKNTGANAKWIILVVPVMIISIVVELLFDYILKPRHFGASPKSDDVYAIAKQFVQPTLRSSHPVFSDEHYQFGIRRASFYVIHSSVDTKTDLGEDITICFRIILKYNGGRFDKKANWTLMDLTEN